MSAAQLETWIHMRAVHIPADSVRLEGVLAAPLEPAGIVLFAQRSQSCRHNRADNYVAGALRERGFATLLFDLVVWDEAERGACFDAQLLAARLIAATEWVGRSMPELSLGYFGTGMGGAAALIAAAHLGERVGAVVCRSARTDLAASALREVRSPTLLLAGSDEPSLLDLNRVAYKELSAPKRLKRINGSVYGAAGSALLDKIARAASEWFHSQLSAPEAGQAAG